MTAPLEGPISPRNPTDTRSYQEFPPNADTGGQGETGCGCECPACQAGQHDKCFWDGGDNLPRETMPCMCLPDDHRSDCRWWDVERDTTND